MSTYRFGSPLRLKLTAPDFVTISGHDSIVNTAVFHPHFFHVVTSGVEKNIILHSPTPSSPCTQNLQPSPSDVRDLRPEDEDQDRSNYLTALLGEHPTLLSEGEDREERRNISVFDQYAFNLNLLTGAYSQYLRVQYTARGR